MSKILVLRNSRSGSASDSFEQLLRPYPEAKLLEIEEWSTAVESIRSACQSSPEIDRLIAVGGDGSVATVATAAALLGLPLGIVPAGTGNLLAKYLGLPEEHKAALEVAMRSSVERCLDAMAVGDRRFFLQLSSGLTTDVSAYATAAQKKAVGPLAYIYQAIRSFWRREERQFEISIDGEPQSLRGRELMVMNVPYVGLKRVDFGDSVRPDDGQLVIYLLADRQLRFARIFQFAKKILTGESLNPLLKKPGKGVTVQLRAPVGAMVQADGDPIGEIPLDICCVPKAVRFVVADAQSEPAN